jgi:hypothetical protein
LRYRHWSRGNRCHKPIWDRVSLRTGYGPECRRKLGYRYRKLVPVIIKRKVVPVIVNQLFQQAETVTAPTQPQAALMLEFARQAYNHREFIYDTWKDLSLSHSVSEVRDKLERRTSEEIRDEFTGCLINGGVHAVSAQLTHIGFFKTPLAGRGPSLDEQTAEVFRKFFESSLTTLVG